MLINLSNHPLSTWPQSQIKAAEKMFGEISDIKFPNINPNWDESGIDNIADEYVAQAINYLKVSGNSLALIVNFGELKLNFKRIVLEQEYNKRNIRR